MDTYGVHGIHGRAPALATGIATARPDLAVWVVTGDGDGLSIGGNHLIHALRRNVNLKILLFNNQIYGLTKGQYSPTSEEGKVTKSTPFGSVDHPFNPIALALGAEATFVARTLDNDRQHFTRCSGRPSAHRGTAFVEIYQNCNVFNDGAFDLLREKAQGVHNQIRLEHGEPIVFDEGNRCVVGGGQRAAPDRRDGDDTEQDRIVVHDAHGRPSLAFALAHLSRGPTEPTCIGVFRQIERPVYGRGDEGADRDARPSASAPGASRSSCTPATPGPSRSDSSASALDDRPARAVRPEPRHRRVGGRAHLAQLRNEPGQDPQEPVGVGVRRLRADTDPEARGAGNAHVLEHGGGFARRSRAVAIPPPIPKPRSSSAMLRISASRSGTEKHTRCGTRCDGWPCSRAPGTRSEIPRGSDR